MSKRTAAALAVAIDELGIAKSTLATAVGVAPGTVSRWLSGKRNPSRKHLREIAEFMGRPISSFIDDEPPTKPTRPLHRRYADLILRGVDPGEAWKVVTGSQSPPSAAEWAIVQETIEESRQILREASKGQWAKLDPQEQEEILDRIDQLAARKRRR